MATPQEIRNRRLSNDYKEMQNIKGAMIDWIPLKGTAPYVEEYEMTVHVRTIINPRPEFRTEHTFKVTLPESYPQAPPQIECTSIPGPFHPNWFKNNRWCFGTWEMSEGLGHHIIRMIRTLQYDLEITNEHSPANTDANEWFVGKKFGGLFPCDTQVLPDPTRTPQQTVRKFSITGLGGQDQGTKEDITPPPPIQEEPPKRGFRLNG